MEKPPPCQTFEGTVPPLVLGLTDLYVCFFYRISAAVRLADDEEEDARRQRSVDGFSPVR